MAFILLLLYTVFLPLSRDGRIYSSVIRLHIPANSNSKEDIELKMDLKDSLCLFVEDMVKDCQSLNEAAGILEKERGKIASFADDFLRQRGVNYLSKVSFGKEYYPTRYYDNISLPAGEYLSLKVELGEGEGENWWCVMFPPLCLSASSPDAEVFQEGVFEAGGEKKFRFFILDFLSSLFK